MVYEVSSNTIWFVTLRYCYNVVFLFHCFLIIKHCFEICLSIQINWILIQLSHSDFELVLQPGKLFIYFFILRIYFTLEIWLVFYQALFVWKLLRIKKMGFCLLIRNCIEEEEQYADKAMLVISHTFDL